MCFLWVLAISRYGTVYHLRAACFGCTKMLTSSGDRLVDSDEKLQPLRCAVPHTGRLSRARTSSTAHSLQMLFWLTVVLLIQPVLVPCILSLLHLATPAAAHAIKQVREKRPVAQHRTLIYDFPHAHTLFLLPGDQKTTIEAQPNPFPLPPCT